MGRKPVDLRFFNVFAHVFIEIARPLYAGEYLGLEMENTGYALDAFYD